MNELRDRTPGFLDGMRAVAVCALVACSSAGHGTASPDGGAGAGATAGVGGGGSAGSAAATGAAGQGTSGQAGGAAGASGAAGQGGGGAMGAAGAVGATSDAGVDASGGAGGDPCATAKFCDDFESYTAGAAPKGLWKVTTNQGTVTVDSTHAHSGKNAVHALTTGAQAYESAFMGLEGAPLFPIANDGFYGRMMMYATQAPADVVHWTILQGEGPVPGQNITRAYYRYGGQYNLRFMANYDSGPAASDCWRHSQTTIPLNAWACVEWQFDGPTNTMHFWLDGKELDDITIVGKGDGCISQGTMGNWYAPAFDALRLGWEHYQQGPGEVWIDDVVVDTKRIGCPAP